MFIWNTKEGVNKSMICRLNLHFIMPVGQKNLFAGSLGANEYAMKYFI